MELIRFLAELIFGWVRDTLVNLSGRFAEEFVARRIKGRKSKRQGKPRIPKRNG